MFLFSGKKFLENIDRGPVTLRIQYRMYIIGIKMRTYTKIFGETTMSLESRISLDTLIYLWVPLNLPLSQLPEFEHVL